MELRQPVFIRPKQYDGSTDAQIALSTIGRVNQRFGMGYVVEVIRGANNQRIRDDGHQTRNQMAWAVIKAMNIG